MKLDVLTLEVGSTMTKANGFVYSDTDGLAPVAQGFAPTTVAEGDVSLGVERAIRNLEETWGGGAAAAEVAINSSAAGGLKMTVHGLTLNMTARAAKEASLGAGAIIKKLTAGELLAHDLEEITAIQPNLILLAGGVDFGEREIVLENAAKLLSLPLRAPLLYAGNVALQSPIRDLAKARGRELFIAENVFPAVDTLNVAPLRKLIHEAFSRHIIHAPGMQKLSRFTTNPVLPTPGAVLLATELFAEAYGDALVIDVGGATSDVHSVTEGSAEYAAKLIDPEPRAKRTVEGDLGVFVNADNILALDTTGTWPSRRSDLRAVPVTAEEQALTRWLCQMATITAVQRHAGVVTEIFTPTGKKQIVRGKDLTAVRTVVGTGGALTRIEGGEDVLRKLCLGGTTHLLPPPDARVVLDRSYLFSALGTIARQKPERVKKALGRILS